MVYNQDLLGENWGLAMVIVSTSWLNRASFSSPGTCIAWTQSELATRRLNIFSIILEKIPYSAIGSLSPNQLFPKIVTGI